MYPIFYKLTKIFGLVFICLGSEILDPDMLICKIRKKSELLEAVTFLYKYTNAEKLWGDHCVKIVKWQGH
jgi:hypothetical protein